MPAQPKSTLRTRAQDRASQKYQDAKARRACVEAVWKRAGDTGDGLAWCEECGYPVYRFKRAESLLVVGHVHEKRAKSLGGDPHNPAACVLLCGRDHFNGPSGAHRRSEARS